MVAPGVELAGVKMAPLVVSNYAQLALVKKKYDPTGLFIVHTVSAQRNGVRTASLNSAPSRGVWQHGLFPSAIETMLHSAFQEAVR